MKDLSLVLSTAADSNNPMPLASLVRDRLLSGLAGAGRTTTWSALSLGAREDAGLS